ncbi:hypothetical protein ACP4OV_012598 [Aristida adscensionis]
MLKKGLLHSDQELFNNGSTDNIVRNFATSEVTFKSAFAVAMSKMASLAPTPTSQGEIRIACSRVN